MESARPENCLETPEGACLPVRWVIDRHVNRYGRVGVEGKVAIRWWMKPVTIRHGQPRRVPTDPRQQPPDPRRPGPLSDLSELESHPRPVREQLLSVRPDDDFCHTGQSSDAAGHESQARFG